MFQRALTAAALLAAVGGPAWAHEARSASSPDGILAELPANAPPGECYARVQVPGEPLGPPPMIHGARWEKNPGPPGSPGPVWCLVPTAAVPAPPPPPRYGWIRVLCDRDATPARIGRLQRELHEGGFYQGEFTGRYDERTAAAVSAFQTRRHIHHGGYLSRETLEALEGGQAYAQQGYAQDGWREARGAERAYGSDREEVTAFAEHAREAEAYEHGRGHQGAACPHACGYEAHSAYGQGGDVYRSESYEYQSYGYGPQPLGPPAAGASAYAGSWGGSASAYVGPTESGWLTWPGKTRF